MNTATHPKDHNNPLDLNDPDIKTGIYNPTKPPIDEKVVRFDKNVSRFILLSRQWPLQPGVPQKRGEPLFGLFKNERN